MASDYPAGLDDFTTIAADKKQSDTVGGRTYAYGVDTDVPSPGRDEAVVTDAATAASRGQAGRQGLT